jgi:hypothetical protein
VTIDNNTHGYVTGAGVTPKAGLAFAGGGSAATNVEIYNSIIVNGDDLSQKSIHWAKTNPVNIVNSILGGLEAATDANVYLDDESLNNVKGRIASFAGLDTALSSQGGNTQVLTIGSNAVDYCTAATGITLPSTDQRGVRRYNPDAGAFEVGTLGVASNDAMDDLISVFPNPATDYIQVKAKGAIDTIKIYSLVGVLKKVATEGDNIDVSDLSKGMYVVIIDTDGQQVASKLVID